MDMTDYYFVEKAVALGIGFHIRQFRDSDAVTSTVTTVSAIVGSATSSSMSGFWRCHSPLYKLQAQRCAFGHVQKPVTVPDPIPESGGQPHQSASHLFIDHPLVLVVFWQAALAVSVTEAVFSNQCQKPHVLFPKSFQAHLGETVLSYP